MRQSYRLTAQAISRIFRWRCYADGREGKDQTRSLTSTLVFPHVLTEADIILGRNTLEAVCS